MSEATQVVEQWEATAQLCHDLAGAAIDLKTVALNLPGAEEIRSSRLVASRRRAGEIVTAIARALDSPFDIVARAELPGSLIAWLRAGQPGDAVNARSLARLREHLSGGPQGLDPDDLRLLDTLTGVLDQQATALCVSVARHAGVER